ncbi:uncharacterized protein LOC144496071 [Mustelus asterias]
MNHLQGIVLLVGFLTLTISAAASAVTSVEVASASVAYYNRRFASPNAFKLLRIIGKKEQDLNELTTYLLRLQMKETTCSADLGISEIANCDFKNDGVTMLCTSRVIVSNRPNSEPRVFSMKCMSATSQRPGFNPDEWAVIARLRDLSSNETIHSAGSTSTLPEA